MFKKFFIGLALFGHLLTPTFSVAADSSAGRIGYPDFYENRERHAAAFATGQDPIAASLDDPAASSSH